MRQGSDRAETFFAKFEMAQMEAGYNNIFHKDYMVNLLYKALNVTNSSLSHLSILYDHHHVADHQKPIHQTIYRDARPGPKLFQILSHDIIGHYSFSHMTSSL
jgi:hypothetical protein